MPIRFTALPTPVVRALQEGGPDAYGRPPEGGHLSDGQGVPCRHCLRDVPAGRGYLILALRPFSELQPYAETGPVFLCADRCEGWAGEGVPPILTTSVDYLLKGYSAAERIVYGSGRVVPREAVAGYAEELLARDDIAFVDVRSARNNCFQCRILRA